MSDAITEARDAQRRREEKQLREDVIHIGHNLTVLREQKENIQLRIDELEYALTKLLGGKR